MLWTILRDVQSALSGNVEICHGAIGPGLDASPEFLGQAYSHWPGGSGVKVNSWLADEIDNGMLDRPVLFAYTARRFRTLAPVGQWTFTGMLFGPSHIVSRFLGPPAACLSGFLGFGDVSRVCLPVLPFQQREPCGTS